MNDPCLSPRHLLSHADALRRLLAHATPLAVEQVTATQAGGRVLAADVIAGTALPGFDNAAMDGYALHGDPHTLRAGSVLTVAGTVVAGDAPPTHAAQAWEIMTGAPLPPDTDTIVPVEHTERLDARHVRLREDVRPGQHLRRQGSDMQVGECFATAGRRVDATLRMLLAAQGIATVAVRMRPRVAILSSGNELVDDPDAALSPGQIRASNGPYLAAALCDAGAQVVAHHTLGDAPELFATRLSEVAADADLVLTTGAVSAGIHDFIPQALHDAGAHVLFHKAAIRPGKPLLAARLPGGAMVLGLPGNPAATAAGFRFFAVPLLRAWQGLDEERPLRARLTAECQGRGGFRQFLKARVGHDAEGQLQVDVLRGQEAFRIGALLDANAWAVIDEDAGLLPVGAVIDVFPHDAGGRWSFD